MNTVTYIYDENSETFEYKGRVYDVSSDSLDTRHGGPFDRGSADSYYGRRSNPHYYVGGTGTSDRMEEVDLSIIEVEAYRAGYLFNEWVIKDFKEW